MECAVIGKGGNTSALHHVLIILYNGTTMSVLIDTFARPDQQKDRVLRVILLLMNLFYCLGPVF